MLSKSLRLLTVASVVLGAATARADVPNPAPYIGVYGGGNLVLRDWDLGTYDHRATAAGSALLPETSGIVGLRLGYQILPQLAIEGELAYLPLDATGGKRNDTLAYELDVLFHLLKGNWSPTIDAGFGGYSSLGAPGAHGAGDLGIDIDPRFHLGVGLRGMITSWMALRIDVRDVISDGFDNWGSNNLEILGGLDFFLASGRPPDRDKDGIADKDDACPDQAGPASTHGCPDQDGDGIADKDDKCPTVAGLAKLGGCPDKDGDGVTDAEDQCPDVPAGAIPDAKRPGCPADKDGDGVIDEKDACVDVPAGKIPDAKRAGCPADRDGDGVIDEKDECIDVPAGKIPDPKRAGCPSDKDNDSVPDETDACPDKPGAPDPDPKKNGCPGLVKIEQGQIKILQQVYFATAKDTILPKSFPVMNAVLNAVKALPPGRRVAVEGHTDNKGNDKMNMDLSQRRAESVKKWLVDHGVDAARLDAKGYGPTRPIADNKTEKGRAQNRRVEFHISEAE